MNRRLSLHGFTLVELLVVVAIIVALLAILLPSMRRATDLAIRTVCGSREHQMFVSYLSYAQGNSGAFPTHNRTTGTWMWDMDEVNVRRLLIELGLDESNNEMFHCPERSVVAGNPQWYWLDGSFDPWIVSGYAWFARSPASGPPAMLNGYGWVYSIASVNRPSESPIIADGTAFDTGTARWAGFADRNNARTAHLDVDGEPTGGNISYVDGSTRWKDFDQMTINYTSGPNWYW